MSVDELVYDEEIGPVEVMDFVVVQQHPTVYPHRRFDCPPELNGNDEDDDDDDGDDAMDGHCGLNAEEALNY